MMLREFGSDGWLVEGAPCAPAKTESLRAQHLEATGRPCPLVIPFESNGPALRLGRRLLSYSAELAPSMGDAAYRRAVANLSDSECDDLERRVAVYVARVRELHSKRENRHGGIRGGGRGKQTKVRRPKLGHGGPSRRGRLG